MILRLVHLLNKWNFEKKLRNFTENLRKLWELLEKFSEYFQEILGKFVLICKHFKYNFLKFYLQGWEFFFFNLREGQ